MSNEQTPDSLFKRLAGQAGQPLPPVHRWQPREVKDIGMRISRDGTWWHQGAPIRRERMVRLFSRILRRDGEEYFLITPWEKVRVEVELAPLLAVRMETREGEAGLEIAFETNTGDLVVADADHPVRVRGTPEAPLPVVEVRDGIEALIGRNVYYELVALAEVETAGDTERLVLRSRGACFELGEL